ncbi:hypothetical protein TNCV_175001 [Trichonephila clavipes]|nr:hypothetical protein TNCV_175001 [Trichonephila clavipes]
MLANRVAAKNHDQKVREKVTVKWKNEQGMKGSIPFGGAKSSANMALLFPRKLQGRSPTKALEPIQTQNNFETLTPDPDAIIQMTTENIAPKPRAPNPITFKCKNYREQIKMLKETFPDLQIKSAGEYFKFYPNNIDQSRSLTHFLESDIQFQFYTIPLQENKPLKVVIKGLYRVSPSQRKLQ